MDMIVEQQGQNSTKTLNGKLRILFVTAAVAFLGLTQAATADSYKLNPGDQVEISVWNEDNLQKTITVLPDGMISFPLVGHLQAAGKSAAEIETTIAAKLDTYIAEPEVNVTVTSTRGNVIFVVGKVLKPGPIVMIQSTTVMQALAMAGGLNEFASANSIKIIRRSGLEKGAQETLLKIRYSDLEKGNDLASNHILNYGDVIVVP
jgi:polysaccharide export outer membrane protein